MNEKDIIKYLVDLINGAEEGDTIYDVRDEICYNLDNKELCETLVSMGMEISPATPFRVIKTPKSVRVFNIADTLIFTTTDNIQHMSDEEIVDYIYKNFWDEIVESYQQP